MKLPFCSNRFRWRWGTIPLLIAISAGVVLAEEVVVQVQTLVIRAGKGSMFPPVAQAKNQDKLEVIERQPDGWLKVKTSAGDGFIKESSLKPRDPGILSGLSQGANAVSGNTSDVGASAAARGIGEDAFVYASNNRMRTDALERMVRTRDQVAGQRWMQFTREGQIGPSKSR